MFDLDQAFAASRDLVIALDAHGSVTYRNAAAIARPLDVETGERLAAAARGVAVTGAPDLLEWGELGPSGVRAWFSTELTPIEGGVLAISRDLTQLRRREQLMVDTQGVAHLGTWEWDVSLPHASWSTELFRIYGLTPEQYKPSYEAYLTMVHPDDRQRVIDATNRVFHEHIPYSHDERIFRPDGSMRYLHTWAYPLLDASGKLTHLIGVCQDITDRALIDEQLQQLNAELEARVRERTAQLEETMRELEAFTSMVSHDLRAPLTVIQMSAELLAPEVTASAKGTKSVERIHKAVKNMSTLMDDLLTFARVSESALQTQTLDVSVITQDIVTELRATTPGRDVSVTIEAGLTCTADPRLFRALLMNVLSNAWKYTSKEPYPRIEIGRGDRAGVPALFVRDNGIGFDPKDATKLFAPFERLKNALELPGTGIGLAIVHKIAQRHGGRVDAESRLGEGATFYVTLPDVT